MRKHIGIIALIFAVVLIGVLVITPLLAQEEEEEEEAPAPRGCGIATGCHGPESKYNLQYEIDGIEGHPQITVDGVDDCTQCHNFRTVEESGTMAPNLANHLHFLHMTSEHFEGNCYSCHMIDEEGEMALFNFVTGNF